MTLEDLANLLLLDYQLAGRRSIADARQSLAHLESFFGTTTDSSAITYTRILEYVTARMGQGRKPATVRKELAALKRAFNLARRAEPATIPPAFPAIKVDNARRGFIDRAGYERLLRVLPPYLRGVLTFLYVTGWRRGEVLSLRWTHVDWEEGVVRLDARLSKNGEGRVFPFHAHAELRALLDHQWKWKEQLEAQRHSPVTHVFHKNGKPIASFRKAWAKARGDAQISLDLRPHDFRRTAARNFDRAGVRRSTAMKLMGHKTESIYLRYAVADHADLEEGVARVGSLHHDDALKTQADLFSNRSRERLDAKPKRALSPISTMPRIRFTRT